MNLNQYLDETSETDAAFGARAGLSQSQINRLKRGVSQPSFDAIKKIAAASDGKVAFADWMADSAAPTMTESAA
jgi:transcriptional regulator with XRE-family HTH domain